MTVSTPKTLPSSQYRIRAIRPFVVHANMRNWIFVKVETDEPDLYGWGEATLEWKTQSVVGAIHDISRFVIGEDPFRIEHIYQIMTRQYFWRSGIEGMSAISGIEHALWDIKGKALGVPVYELLGGRVRDQVRVYDHLGGGQMETMYETVAPESFADQAALLVKAGCRALKFMAVPRTAPVEGTESVRYAERVVQSVREAVGPTVDLMVDLHGRTWPAMAMQYCRALEPYGLLFFEEPCPVDDLGATAEVTRVSRIPIATGERLVGRHQFSKLLESRACHIIQPDMTHCGGLWEARKIAAAAETYSIAVAPHNPNGPISSIVATHFAVATPNWIIQEMVTGDVPWRGDVISHDLRATNGVVNIPDGPGLGFEVDETVAALHPIEPEAEQRYFHPDGSVADW